MASILQAGASPFKVLAKRYCHVFPHELQSCKQALLPLKFNDELDLEIKKAKASILQAGASPFKVPDIHITNSD
jgi:hypothetical protein